MRENCCNLILIFLDSFGFLPRIIIADVYDSAARSVMCAAYQLKMTAAEGYVWFLPQWLNQNWYNTDELNPMANVHEKVECSTAQMAEVSDIDDV